MGRTPERVVDLLSREIPAKISRNKFCLQTGINQNSVDKYMAGIAEPTQASLQKLADYFKVSVPYLRGQVWWTNEEDREMNYVELDHFVDLVELYGLAPDRLKGTLACFIHGNLSDIPMLLEYECDNLTEEFVQEIKKRFNEANKFLGDHYDDFTPLPEL